MRLDSLQKKRGLGSTALAAPLRAGAIGPDLIEAFVFDPAPPAGGGAATWHTPSAPFAITPASPPQYYQATLAWSYRHDPGEINYPRVTNRMLLSDQGTFLNIQDGDDTVGRQFIAQAISWGWSNAYLTQIVTGFLKPSQTHNFVMLFSQTGALSGGNTVQLWCNGVLVASTSTVLSDFSLYSMTLLGEGSTVLPGETQGFWFSGDTAIDPATVFADLFDGTNGMLDINADPSVGGVSPDNYYIEPGSGPSGITGTASGTADVTGSAAASARTTASVSGTADVTGASAGTLRAFATITGTANVTGTATATAGSTSIIGTASGAADVTGAASGTLRAAATASGTADTTGASAGTLRAFATVTGAADTTGAATVSARTTATATGASGVTGASTGTMRATATASGSVGVSGAATGAVSSAPTAGTASGVAGVTGAATATLRAVAVAAGSANVTGTSSGTLRTTADASGAADVSGQAMATLRAIAEAAGFADVTGAASTLPDTSRHIIVAGVWQDNTFAGVWATNAATGIWPSYTVAGVWREEADIGTYRENIVQGEWA
jgi:hypothetical protein